MKDEIIQEMIYAMERLGAQSDLLSIVCSLGDSLSDEQVLEALREWNRLHPIVSDSAVRGE